MKFFIGILGLSSLLSVYSIPVSNSSSVVQSALPTPASSVVDSAAPSASIVIVSNSSAGSTLPPDAKMLAVNEGSGNLAAYGSSGPLGNFIASSASQTNQTNHTIQAIPTNHTEGSLVAAAASSNSSTSTVNTCRSATDAEVTLIPGWQQVTDFVTKFASGQAPEKVYVNDASYPNLVASICYGTDTIDLSISGTPTCSSSQAQETANSNADSGNLTLTQNVVTGMTSTVSTTTTQTSQFSWSDAIQVKANVAVLELSSTQTIGLQITNTVGTETTTATDSQISTGFSYHTVPGKTCVLCANTTTCTYDATGSIDLTLSGGIWFQFKTWFRDPACVQSLVQPGQPCAGVQSAHNDLNHCYDNNNCPTHGHWNFIVEDIIPSVSDRSQPLQFKNGVDSSLIGAYENQCR